jgi:hypothetical protein
MSEGDLILENIAEYLENTLGFKPYGNSIRPNEILVDDEYGTTWKITVKKKEND